MAHWTEDAIFYHIYPLGYCGAPGRNDGVTPPENRLGAIEARLDSIKALGVNALYLGPLFESAAHGYDTSDYGRVDRRLGTNEDLGRLIGGAKARGMRVVLDGVFNHVGLGHPWFRDLQARGQASPWAGAFKGLDFSRPGPGASSFAYETWRGCGDLAVRDLSHPAVREELLGAVAAWIRDWDIDGLRLDAADCVDLGFQGELARVGRSFKPDFWLMGEVIHGDYRRWARPGPLDSVTNYEAWKGLWSSLKDANYFEIAWTLKREFGESGLYRDLSLYNFADNHDVDRARSQVGDPRLLYPLYCLLYTMPGIPSIYYGSEYGVPGRKAGDSDAPLRPSIAQLEAGPREPDLAPVLVRLARLRQRLPALRRGSYSELLVGARQFAFLREWEGQKAIVALNSDSAAIDLDLALPFQAGDFRDELEAEGGGKAEVFRAQGTRLRLRLNPGWARVLVPA